MIDPAMHEILLPLWLHLVSCTRSGRPGGALTRKNVANEPSFLLFTHTTSFNIRINRYEFLKSDFAAEKILGRLTIQAFDQNFGPQDE
jgi:hypothetical protein